MAEQQQTPIERTTNLPGLINAMKGNNNPQALQMIGDLKRELTKIVTTPGYQYAPQQRLKEAMDMLVSFFNKQPFSPYYTEIKTLITELKSSANEASLSGASIPQDTKATLRTAEVAMQMARTPKHQKALTALRDLEVRGVHSDSREYQGVVSEIEKSFGWEDRRPGASGFLPKITDLRTRICLAEVNTWTDSDQKKFSQLMAECYGPTAPIVPDSPPQSKENAEQKVKMTALMMFEKAVQQNNFELALKVAKAAGLDSSLIRSPAVIEGVLSYINQKTAQPTASTSENSLALLKEIFGLTQAFTSLPELAGALKTFPEFSANDPISLSCLKDAAWRTGTRSIPIRILIEEIKTGFSNGIVPNNPKLILLCEYAVRISQGDSSAINGLIAETSQGQPGSKIDSTVKEKIVELAMGIASPQIRWKITQCFQNINAQIIQLPYTSNPYVIATNFISRDCTLPTSGENSLAQLIRNLPPGLPPGDLRVIYLIEVLAGRVVEGESEALALLKRLNNGYKTAADGTRTETLNSLIGNSVDTRVRQLKNEAPFPQQTGSQNSSSLTLPPKPSTVASQRAALLSLERELRSAKDSKEAGILAQQIFSYLTNNDQGVKESAELCIERIRKSIAENNGTITKAGQTGFLTHLLRIKGHVGIQDPALLNHWITEMGGDTRGRDRLKALDAFRMLCAILEGQSGIIDLPIKTEVWKQIVETARCEGVVKEEALKLQKDLLKQAWNGNSPEANYFAEKVGLVERLPENMSELKQLQARLRSPDAEEVLKAWLTLGRLIRIRGVDHDLMVNAKKVKAELGSVDRAKLESAIRERLALRTLPQQIDNARHIPLVQRVKMAAMLNTVRMIFHGEYDPDVHQSYLPYIPFGPNLGDLLGIPESLHYYQVGKLGVPASFAVQLAPTTATLKMFNMLESAASYIPRRIAFQSAHQRASQQVLQRCLAAGMTSEAAYQTAQRAGFTAGRNAANEIAKMFAGVAGVLFAVDTAVRSPFYNTDAFLYGSRQNLSSHFIGDLIIGAFVGGPVGVSIVGALEGVGALYQQRKIKNQLADDLPLKGVRASIEMAQLGFVKDVNLNQIDDIARKYINRVRNDFFVVTAQELAGFDRLADLSPEEADKLYNAVVKLDELAREVEDLKNEEAWQRNTHSILNPFKGLKHRATKELLEDKIEEFATVRREVETYLGLREVTLGVPSVAPVVLLDNANFLKLVNCLPLARMEERRNEELYRHAYLYRYQGDEQQPGEHRPTQTYTELNDLNKQFEALQYAYVNEPDFVNINKEVEESRDFIALVAQVTRGKCEQEDVEAYYRDEVKKKQENYRKNFQDNDLPKIQQEFIAKHFPFFDDVLLSTIELEGNPAGLRARNVLEIHSPAIFAWAKNSGKVKEADDKLEAIAASKESLRELTKMDPEIQEIFGLLITMNTPISDDLFLDFLSAQ